ncbi:LamG-like jellyroll fold domain-containing protein [Azospirillum cavernae]|uniref:LamG-like jellyroll fold domain-containing protein n=1 Tax=Azospirillum cavernae TaxID=2320860 RepID=UPI0018F77087|nr:LamG-like jellyroll fold domain-containing protein [Azospirillum cavernae]
MSNNGITLVGLPVAANGLLSARSSVSTVAIGAGVKLLMVDTGKGFEPSMWVVASDAANPANSMAGSVVDYNPSSGALTIQVVDARGGGTPASWMIAVSGQTGLTGPQGIQGEVGPQGPQGVIGPVGPQGDKGDTGVQGPVGLTGPQGPQGVQGPQGDKGDTGAQGPVGATGAEGPQGVQGPQGDKGDTGAQGPIGATGPQGPQGVQGPPGDQGDTGAQGPIGLTGPQGPQGVQGPQGDKGDTGAQGPVGLTGAEGPQGVQGPVGATGPQGPGVVWAGNSGGVANAPTLTPTPALSGLTGNPSYEFIATVSNSGPVTLNVSGTGAVALRKANGAVLSGGELQAGTKYAVTYDGAVWRLAGGDASVLQTAPTYAASGATTTVTGELVLAAYEQIAGQTFNLNYNTRANYAEQDAANGTDATGGAFALHNVAGGTVDANTKLLIHADSPNGSTEIIDERGITPFGTHCAYFDGTAYFKVPSSNKVAFGATQNFTVELWMNTPTLADAIPFDARNSGSEVGPAITITANGAISFRFASAPAVFSAAGVIVAGAWHHMALVRNGTLISLYVNGVSVASTTTAYTVANGPMLIGAAWDLTNKFTGWIDQLRVSNTARYTAGFMVPTAEFVTDANTVHLFQFNDGHGSQFIRDSSKSGHEMAVSGASSLTNARAKFGATSLNCTGGGAPGGGVIVANSKSHADFNMGSDDFSVDLWFYATNFANAALFSYGNTAVNYYLGVEITSGGGVTVAASTNNTSWNVSDPSVSRATYALNTWTHIAMTRSGSNLHLFVNGVLAVTFSGVTGSLFNGTTACFNIARYSGSSTFVGQMDEFRIKRGQAAWISNFTPSASPYETDDATILLCHFDGADGDVVTLDSSESSYGTNAFGDTTNPALTFAGSAALDTTYTRGGNSTSLKLNGSSQYASVSFATPSAGHPIYFGIGEQYCIEAWVYVSSFTGIPVVFNIVGASNGTEGNPHLWYDTIRSSWIYAVNTSATTVAQSATTTATGWVHLAVVRDGRGYVVYVNGVGSAPANPTTNISYTSESYNLFIGAYHGSLNYLNGAIDSFRITHGKPRYTANFTPGNLTQDDDTALLWVFNGAPGQKWVKELSKNTALIQSVNARTVKDGVYIPAPGNGLSISTAQFAFGSGSLAANGSAQYLDIPSATVASAFTGNFTVDFKVRFASLGGGNHVSMVTKGSTSLANMTIQIQTIPTSNAFRFTLYNTSGTPVSAVSATTAVVNTWYHVAAVLNGGAMLLFINGVLEGTTPMSGVVGANANPLTVGSFWNGSERSEFFNGYIDELRVSNTARWTANFTPSTGPYSSEQNYVTGPYWVATKPGASALDLSAFSSIDGAAFSGATPPGTTLRFLASFDGYASPLARWNGSAWVSSGYAMTWDGSTLTTTATAAQLNGVGNSWAELQAGLLAWSDVMGGTVNIVAVLSTSNPSFTPSLDNIAVTMDEYVMMTPGVDYSVRRKKSAGAQTLTLTRVKSGGANQVVAYIP